MAAQVVPLIQRTASASRDWSQREIAEFYRVESALVQAGLALETDRGVTDEGDPWFAFCRADTGEVFIHFARIAGLYVVAGVAFPEPARGHDFTALVRDLVSRHPLAGADVLPFARRRVNSNVFLHPAALLIAVVGAAFFHTGQAKAAEIVETAKPANNGATSSGTPATVAALIQGSAPSSDQPALTIDSSQAATILAAALISYGRSAQGESGAGSAIVSTPDSNGAAPLSTTQSVFNKTLDLLAPSQPIVSVAGEAHAARGDTSGLSASAMKSLVALTAVLSDLAGKSGNVGTAAPIVGSLSSAVHDATAAPAYVAPDHVAQLQASAQSLILVRFHAAGLPDLEAVQSVQSSGALANLDIQLPTSNADRLPQALLDLLARTTTGSDPSLASHPADSDSLTTGLDLTNAPIVGDASDTNQSAASAGSSVAKAGAAADATATRSTTTSVSTSPVPANASHIYGAHDPQVSAAVLQFASLAPKLDAVVTGHNVVLFDSHALASVGAAGLDTVTFNFDDGSTISLVGTVQELAQSHLS